MLRSVAVGIIELAFRLGDRDRNQTSSDLELTFMKGCVVFVCAPAFNFLLGI